MFSDVVLEASYAVAADDKPKFEAAETAREWDAPVLKCNVKEFCGSVAVIIIGFLHMMRSSTYPIIDSGLGVAMLKI